MKLILENWRRYLSEITVIPSELKQTLKQAIADSQFWTYPHTEDEVDLVGEDEFSTPAIEALMGTLNNAAENLGADLHFLLTVTHNEEYTLGPGDQYGGYPNNWVMQGQYRGPHKNKHVIWLEFRPISEDYNMKELSPNKLVGIVSRAMNHELVHYNQLKKQSESKGISEKEAWGEMLADPKQFPKTGERSNYLSRHIEVDAFAHEAAEQLLDAHSAEETLTLIKTRDPKLKGVVRDYLNVLGDNPQELKKFWSKLYTQIERQSETPT